jgi:iron complex transport system substrate-binding protein
MKGHFFLNFILGTLPFLLLLAPASASGKRIESVGAEVHRFPDLPRRVVVLAPQLFDDVLELGVIPIGAPKMRSSYLRIDPKLWDTIVETDWSSPNFERILRLKPDLILTAPFDKSSYLLLNHIARTVMIDITTYGDWKDRLLKVGAALGRSGMAEQLIWKYERHSDRVRAAIAGRGFHVFPFTVTTESIALIPPNYFCWTILRKAGFLSPPFPKIKGRVPKIITWISWERLTELDCDALFLIPAGFGGEKRTQSAMPLLESQPLWRNLRAVKNHRVYQVGTYWMAGGATSAERVLEDVEQALFHQ